MIPQNEQGTIVLFAKLAKELGYTFKEIGTHCPDAILEKDGRSVRVEFEHKAATFRVHKHDPAAVDLIICWEDDWPQAPVPVLSLEKYVTLARREPELTLWQRVSSKWAGICQAIRDRKNACPICGYQMTISCDDPEWADSRNYYQWVNRRCSKCNYFKTEIYP